MKNNKMLNFSFNLLLWMIFSVFAFCRANGENTIPSTWFTLDIGDLWMLEDNHGVVEIKVAEIHLGMKNTYKVTWSTKGKVYQSEFWKKIDGKYYVVGRGVLGREIFFDEPYVFLKEGIAKGDSWKSFVKFGHKSIELTFSVTAQEKVKTEVGELEAFKVEVKGPRQFVERWYSPKVGLVKEIGHVIYKGKISEGNAKILIKHVDGSR